MAYQQQQGGFGGPYEDPNYGAMSQQFQQPYPQFQHQQPNQAPSNQSGAWHPTDAGTFEGGDYTIQHRDCNTILKVTLAPGAGIKSRSGAMKEMSPTVMIQGKAKFSFKNMLKGGHLHESYYMGPGDITLAPVLFGDIATLRLDGSCMWYLGKHAFLASTLDVQRELKSQGFNKGLFGGQSFFIFNVTGHGTLWMHSFGAITQRELGPGEQHIVEHGHLVAWNCEYSLEQPGAGVFSGMKTGEGLVCRFTGPGTIYIQTRNFYQFEGLIAEIAMAVSN